MKINTTVLILAGCCIIMAVFIFSLLRKIGRPAVGISDISKAYEEVVKAKDETIAIYKEQNIKLDELIAGHERTDSILISKITANQAKYTTNDKKLKDVSAAVGNLDVEQLKREYANY